MERWPPLTKTVSGPGPADLHERGGLSVGPAGDKGPALLKRKPGRRSTLRRRSRAPAHCPRPGATKMPKSVDDLPADKFLAATVTVAALIPPGLGTVPSAGADRVRRNGRAELQASLKRLKLQPSVVCPLASHCRPSMCAIIRPVTRFSSVRIIGSIAAGRLDSLDLTFVPSATEESGRRTT